MKEAVGDLWTYPADWRVVTTNGYASKNNVAAMSAGCALEATMKYPGVDRRLGYLLNTTGNNVYKFSGFHLFTFPVKKHWSDKADLELIRRSVEQLQVYLLDEDVKGKLIVMPRPGCGFGLRSWEEVKPLLFDLPDNVTVITFPNNVKVQTPPRGRSKK